LRPLRNVKFSQVGKKVRGSSGGATTAVRSAGGKRSGPLVSTSIEELRRRKEETDRPSDLTQKSRQPLDREKVLRV
jgi:hypothetical protein